MYCIQCGIELPDDAIFCPKCGKRAADADRQADDKSQSVHSTEKVDMVMDTGRSPFTLAFTIAFSAQILFSLVDSNFSLLSVIALILETVICVGSWMVYVSSYQHLASPTGFSVLHIGVPIYLVFSMFQMFRSAIEYQRPALSL